ncbi:MAG: hypothetical protein KAS94_13480 [Desulfobulbaceae bacterium]|nr:hypothetical protein [Desulfobulbaceae bacterium]
MLQKSNQAKESATLTRISYWLMPAAGERGRFVSLITRLAGEFGGPPFAPHLTVYSGPADGSDDPGRIVKEAVSHGGELLLRCTGLEFSEKFTKACFLGFAPEPRLNRLSEALRENSCHSESYQLKPHLSLFYGDLTRQDRERIRNLVEIPGTVRFDGLTAMATSAAVRTGKDVESWSQLAGPPSPQLFPC